MTLTEYRQLLQDIQTAKQNLINTGEAYTVVGSHSNKRVSYDDLIREEKRVKEKIYLYSGYSTRRTKPSFN